MNLVRLLPKEFLKARSPFELSKIVPVKWQKKEKRKPHINFMYRRYTGDCLDDQEVVKTMVEIRYDYRDIRTLKVYTLQGKFLGVVYAPRNWQRFPFSVKTSQYIHWYCTRNRIHMEDPLVEYFQVQKDRKNQLRGALELTRLFREYTAFPTQETPEDILEIEYKQDSESPTQPAVQAKTNTKVQWTLEAADAKQNRK